MRESKLTKTGFQPSRGRALLNADRGFALGGWGWLMHLGVDPLIEGLQAGLLQGRLIAHLPDGQQRHIGGHAPGPVAEVRLLNWRPARRLIAGGLLGWSRSYIDGDWDSPDLVALAELFSLNRVSLNATTSGSWLAAGVNSLAHALRANTRAGSRRNIAFHYDLGNDFYASWLDAGMTYSSAVFETPDQSLEAAQTVKYRRLLDSLHVKPGEHLLEIGCGWGGLAAIAARDYGLIVTGLTLSAAQLDHGRAHIARAGLADRVDLKLCDYREIGGRYDHIISIEMLEAVGQRYWQTYMDVLMARLRPGGRAALQVITIDEAIFDTYRRGADFIQTYIFPGGMLPTVARLKSHAARAGLEWRHQASHGADYARTLALWRERFDAARAGGQLPPGFDTRFQRIWHYYLTYCEGGFRAGGVDVIQALLSRPG